MQPTYLPWAGYFNLIKQVDKFVFLDDVQFERQSWQTKNRILLNGIEHYLILPVNRCHLGELIGNIVINERSNWRKSHWLTLRAAYSKARYGEEALAILSPFFESDEGLLLSNFTCEIIVKISRELGLSANFYRASELDCGGKRSMHLIEICEKLGCVKYLSPEGSRNYLLEDGFTAISGISLDFQKFEPKAYSQYKGSQFVSHLSIIDVIANHGVEYAKSYIC